MERLCDAITQNEFGDIIVPKDYIEIEEELERTKEYVKMKYILKDISYLVILFTKKDDWILEKGV